MLGLLLVGLGFKWWIEFGTSKEEEYRSEGYTVLKFGDFKDLQKFMLEKPNFILRIQRIKVGEAYYDGYSLYVNILNIPIKTFYQEGYLENADKVVKTIVIEPGEGERIMDVIDALPDSDSELEIHTDVGYFKFLVRDAKMICSVLLEEENLNSVK